MGMDRVIVEKKWIKKKYWKYIIGTVILSILLAFVIFNDYESSFKVDKEKLTISEVIDGPFLDYISINGTVEPISVVSVEALEEGRVEKIVVGEGTSMVKEGDVILRLSNEEMKMNGLDEKAYFEYLTNDLNNKIIAINIEELSEKQELTQQEFDLYDKKNSYERNKSLHDKGGVADLDFEKSKRNYEIAKTTRDFKVKRMKLDSAKRENDRRYIQLKINSIKQKIDNLQVKAPVDGQFSLGSIELGQSISKGTKIGQVSVLSAFKIKAKIDEHYIDRIHQGLTASLERQGEQYDLQIMKVYQEVVGGTFEVDLRFQGNMPANIRTGQGYHINLELGEPEQSTLVSLGGFFNSTGGQWIFVVDPSGDFASKKNIRIGRKNPKYYEIIEGLNAGEKVITSGYDLFGDNDKLILK